MFNYLKKHPFAVEAFFESSLVLTFAAPKEALSKLLPECLTVDTLNDKWGFIAVAMVQTRGLRPKGFPAFMGNDFFLTGFRVFVRYTNTSGKSLRGLYILKSETNKKKMEILGNIFTKYNYTTTDFSISKKNNLINISSGTSKFDIEVESDDPAVPLPSSSPFTDWKEARKYAGPLPFTFTYDPIKKEVLIIEGVREHWDPKPVKVNRADISFIKTLGLPECKLANAFIIQNIPYYWKKGKTEKWQH